jgi:hypothetical protein
MKFNEMQNQKNKLKNPKLESTFPLLYYVLMRRCWYEKFVILKDRGVVDVKM